MKVLQTLPANQPRRPPTVLDVLAESRVAWSWLQARRQGLKVLDGLPRGHGQPVMLLPGYGADESHMQTLLERLQALGYNARHWGEGRNHGMIHRLIPALSARIKDWAVEAGQPVHLIGWSLGGYITRELARENPELVASVITLGSPAVGGPKYTITAPIYRRKGFDLDEIEADMAKRDHLPIRCPLTVVFSKRDGVVSWPACLDRKTAHARHVEVNCAHFAQPLDAGVLAVIAGALATA